MLNLIDISTSALVAQRTNMDVIAGNIAMRESVQWNGTEAIPFRRRVALMAPGDPTRGRGAAGVHVASIVEDPAPFGLRWDPEHPQAVKDGPERGYVKVSNVDYHTEMVNAIAAVRAYEANVTVMQAAKSLANTALRLIA